MRGFRYGCRHRRLGQRRSGGKQEAGEQALARGTAKRLGRLAINADETLPQPFRIAEADRQRDGFKRFATILDPRPGQLGAQPIHRLGRAEAGFGQERPAELTRAEARDLRQALDRQILMQMVAGELQ